MPFNTATVSSAVAPAVIQTFVSHYLNRKPLAQKPTAHISYDEGLHLIRKFLLYASHHTVEDIQRFTAQWVPCPTWVLVEQFPIPAEFIAKGAEAITKQLGHHGVQKVGGEKWWQWRRPRSELKAEWIEMRSDAYERKKTGNKGKRVMLYVHGGAYFFGSTDEHRYQMQRHARKLKARVFARIARYRLAPQFPFPCGLLDCLAAYLFLLSVQDPTTIVLAGDSAGGGMIVSMLVTMRDQGIPLPAGAILISPWVDLTHSFPSVSGDCPLDYIPPHGFHQKPSEAWPPPNADEMLAIEEGIVKKLASKDHAAHPQEKEEDAVQGFHIDPSPDSNIKNADANMNGKSTQPTANTVSGTGGNLSIMIDGELVEIKDQIQMYASNQLISHPLVSPILQPSLGGLPPLLILTGGGEMLRDEQIYLAHKAANPSKYPPGDAFLDEFPGDHLREQINKWKPTDVQLQVWEDLCHVAPTLSFTRPAKYMYRSIAQFGAWALARAQKTEIEILDDDDVSIISESDAESVEERTGTEKAKQSVNQLAGKVGKAGDPLPSFKSHMIRQRVDRHGNIFNLEPTSELPALNLSPSEIGVIKPGPVRKWTAAKKEWDTKFASSKRRVQKQRVKEIAAGYQQFEGGEVPPPSALAGRRKVGIDLAEKKHKRSMGMSLWALWGSKHDEKATILEEKLDKEPETSFVSPTDGAGARPLHDTKTKEGKKLEVNDVTSRSRSRRRTVTDQNQTGSLFIPLDENTSAAELLAIKRAATGEGPDPIQDPLMPKFIKDEAADMPEICIKTPTNNDDDDKEYDLKRPKAGGIAFPFSLKGHQTSASMTTLTSAVGVPPAREVGETGTRPSTNGSAAASFQDGVQSENDAVAETSTTSKGVGKEVESANESLITPSKVAERESNAIIAEVNDNTVTKPSQKTKPFQPENLDEDKDRTPIPTPTEKIIANGEVFGPGERPPLETFVTAESHLTLKSVGK